MTMLTDTIVHSIIYDEKKGKLYYDEDGQGGNGKVVFAKLKGKPEDWITGIPTYSRIVYENLWPGIDLVFSGTIDRIKYKFIVKPGADPYGIF